MTSETTPDDNRPEAANSSMRLAITRVIRDPVVIAWIVLTCVVVALLLAFSIPMTSTFAFHSPLVYLPFLIFIPIIFHVMKFDISDRKLPEFTNPQVAVVLCIGLLFLLFPSSPPLASFFLEFIIVFLIPILFSVLVSRLPYCHQ